MQIIQRRFNQGPPRFMIVGLVRFKPLLISLLQSVGMFLRPGRNLSRRWIEVAEASGQKWWNYTFQIAFHITTYFSCKVPVNILNSSRNTPADLNCNVINCITGFWNVNMNERKREEILMFWKPLITLFGVIKCISISTEFSICNSFRFLFPTPSDSSMTLLH